MRLDNNFLHVWYRQKVRSKRHSLMPFVEPEKILRETLDRMVLDGWVLTMLDAVNWEPPDARYREITEKSVEETILRLNGYHADFSAFVRKVDAENLWENKCVDQACEPEEAFTYGAVIEGVLTLGNPATD